MNIFKTDSSIIFEKETFEEGIWINLIAPSSEEIEKIASVYDIDTRDLRAALDDEESSRLQIEDGYTLILIDVPSKEVRNNRNAYTTIPLGIIISTKGAIITVCSEQSSVIDRFINGTVKEFSTKKPLRFVYQIIFYAALSYQTCLRYIDSRRGEIESRAINKDTEDTDLIDLHELESNLVYFATSLNSNMVVLDKLTRYERVKQYPEDKEILDDAIVENRQAIEMTNIYRNIIMGARDLISTVINNRLNNVMKLLASITLVMAIPTVVSGIYGMNLDPMLMPFADIPYGFEMVCLLILIICIVVYRILKKKKML